MDLLMHTSLETDKGACKKQQSDTKVMFKPNVLSIYHLFNICSKIMFKLQALNVTLLGEQQFSAGNGHF